MGQLVTLISLRNLKMQLLAFVLDVLEENPGREITGLF